jgi:putative transposase
MQAASNARELRGLEMAKGIGKDNQPDVSIQRLNKLTYKVRSQSDPEKWYTVVKQYAKTFGDNTRSGEWVCDCPDHSFRKVVCKHIHAVQFSKLLRKRVYQDTLLQTPINQNIINEANQLGKIICQRCASPNYQKFGTRKNKKNEELQRYRCMDCSFVYIVNPAFENAKASAKIISISIDLFMKGTSVRKIADHIKQTYGVKIHYSSVCRFIRRFERTVAPYVESFVPAQVSGVYQVDEMLLHVRKENNDMNMTLENKENHTNRKFDNHYSWLWNLMDSTTRYWICSTITQKRDTEAGRKVLKEMKQRAPLPKAFVHDGLRTYDEVYEKELFTSQNPRIMNVRSIGSNETGLNPKVERLNGTVRDRETVMRGLDNAKAAQELLDAMRIHYNFIRPHSSIGGQTPAEAAGISLNLGENKVESLMRQAAIHNKDAIVQPIVKGLGIRMEKLLIINEKDCFKIKPKGWMDKKDWREIHDILRVQGFNWLSNGKDSCWMRNQQQ